MNVLIFLGLTLLFLVATFFLTALNSAFRRLHRRDVEKHFESKGSYFFYRPFHLFFFPNQEYETLFFSLLCAQTVTRFGYAVSIVGMLAQNEWIAQLLLGGGSLLAWLGLALILIVLLFLVFVVSDYLPRLLGSHFPEFTLSFCAPFASPFLFIAFPFAYIFLKIAQVAPKSIFLDPSFEFSNKEEIMEIVEAADLGTAFDAHDKKLIESVLTFRDRIAREVMVPRVNMFSLAAETPIKEAAQLIEKEGYSRTPIYRNTVDNIVGVLMYKDLLQKYMECREGNPQILDAPIETLQKAVLHVPETKKLSSLMQEFRRKQVHLAIVVDEYGGTEGIVTLEDILEELVGEISDEYDQEERLFYPMSDGGWVVDARLNILDAKEELGIEIPQEGEYDTIGGYIFHTTGTIPSKGFVIHHDAFDMEILESDERSVERVRIRPAKV